MKDVVNNFLVVVFQDLVSDQFMDGFGIITAMDCVLLFINTDDMTEEDLFHGAVRACSAQQGQVGATSGF